MLPKLFRIHRAFAFAILAASTLAFSPRAAGPIVNPERERELLKEVKVPDGFQANIFAAAPAVNYPVFVAAAPDGTLYVSSDKNGSLDREPHRGRVLRVRDLDGDGRADEVKEFIKDVDSPRGLLWDHDRLYLLHPPHLSVFIDHDRNGVSDEQKILVKNIAFGFADRPADHTSNGIELGVDGWIYCAIGDFGFMEAEGTDGRKLQLRAGGVVRVRPDGTGLELYSRGTRNILEVAVSPLLEMFARDNTNDGDGWDIRLHHFTPMSEHGYPSLFKNFSDEIIQPLAIYGGGSGCGAMWLSEPGFPEGYNNAPYTADWGREWVYRHPLTPNGATFKAEQHEFVRATRVTDLDVDAMSRIYVASWKGATFTYAGEDVGYIVRVTPKGYTPEPLPDFPSLNDAELVRLLNSPSHRRRLEAQRQLLRRDLSPETIARVESVASDRYRSLPTRVAALFLLKQEQGSASHPFIEALAADASIREFCVRALGDRLEESQVNPAVLLRALAAPDPAVRREAVFALTRVGAPRLAEAIAPLLADADPIVAHTAMQALRRLNASEPCLAILDDPLASSELRAGAIRVLQRLHEPAVVAGLLTRLEAESSPARRQGLITALARLYFKEGEWKGDSWGTRPDTTGPYYQPEQWSESLKILSALKNALEQSTGAEAAFIARELGRHKIQTDETLASVIRLAADDESLIPSALAQLARTEDVPSAALPLLTKAAAAEETDEIPRAHAVIALAQSAAPEALQAMLKAMPRIGSRGGGKEVQRARRAFLRSRHLDQNHEIIERTAAKMDGEASVWAEAALLILSDRENASPEARAAAQRALTQGWSEPARQPQILRAVALAEHRPWKDKVIKAAASSDARVAEAARRAARALRIEGELKKAQEKAAGPMIADLKIEEALAAAIQAKGQPKLGEEIFVRQTCVNCHTVSPDEPLRGPFLGNIANTYKREDLAAAILIPNKSIAQGFVANYFLLKDGTEHEGFVVQESADTILIRDIAAQEIEIASADIAQRRKLEKSLMPEGLAANLTVKELASLLDYLQSLANKQ